ncbi:beta-glucanase/beta-glucan synthetase [Paenibacillus sp. PR3]|uniref:Beta-glucanase/beta-glucan synthetase n=1 Tax=Paenibacillus terricola TaxID=2763503 RepID=A0ABR8MSP5_9BACL|nr:beta-glucanase/beta-glucan synthetase [Paenibacillus terricola]MBD3919001.1 beta-glucanase/beta-glucan synthetase [Paenibacillus terricola]
MVKNLLGYRLIVFHIMIVLIIFTGGCSVKTIEEAENSEDSNQNPFGKNESESVVLGSISHGFINPQLDKSGRALPLEYNGGELKIDYSVRASGKAKNVGFFIFVGGEPQPYKLNESDSHYQYMHLLELKGDDQDTPFTFEFTPVTGQQGDNLHVSIASIYNPGFMPDMKKTSSYGGYQTTLEVGRSLIYNQNAESVDFFPNTRKEILNHVQLSTEPVTQDLFDKHSIMEKVDMAALDKNVYSDLYIDGEIRQDNLKVQKSGNLHVTFNLFGHSGMRYRNTFYLNHQALASKDGVSFETELTKGNIAVIDADIELENLEDFSTFYVVSVPINANDFPDDVVVLMKTPSLLLYR